MDANRGSDEKAEAIFELWRTEIQPHEGDRAGEWWTFPPQGAIGGFFGVGPLMVIGDQPSTSHWLETHRSRVLLYRTLIKLGVPDAHLTDIIKSRGRGSESRRVMPIDFRLQLDILRREIDIVQPSLIIALGHCPEQLLREHLPDVQVEVRRVLHFSHAARYRKDDQFLAEFCVRIHGPHSCTLGSCVYQTQPAETGRAPLSRNFGEAQRLQQRNAKRAKREHSYARIFTSGTLSLICDPCPNYQPRGDRGATLWKLARDFAVEGTTFKDATTRTGLPKSYLQYFVEKGGIAVGGLTREAAYAD